ncbi:hypothetical protein HIM_08530 [Hirsutella minnesotensis 3608]|uniref:Major facilitator superfamily (MFS) profile domain-containing protein n=1 Tax=Hirsutella minnesotensis 3608 TaxID=1043627 RepID=A0A0F7ZMI0_9HYPO|nr:hypothetical protein HIM_08530 [Hirsutella minnesotensis 3608]
MGVSSAVEAAVDDASQSDVARGSDVTDPKVDVVTVTPLRFWLFSTGVYVGLFLAMMDSSIVAPSLHVIAVDFNVFIPVNWVALAYTLAACGSSVVSARISDVVGRRHVFVAAEVLFLVSSMGCGFSRRLHHLIACRALQGIGGSAIYSMTMVLLPEVCPDQTLEYMAGMAGFVIVVASVAGPLLGAIITHYASWRWIFWINGPVCALSIPLVVALWPKETDTIQAPRHSWKSFDYLGSALLIAASVLVIFAFQNAGVATVDVWGNAIFVAPVVIGLICWAGFFGWQHVVESRRDDSPCTIPVLPLSLFENRFYTSGTLATLLLSFPMFILIFSIPLRAQLISGKDELVASIMLLPMVGASAVGCVSAAALNARKNFVFECILAGA